MRYLICLIVSANSTCFVATVRGGGRNLFEKSIKEDNLALDEGVIHYLFAAHSKGKNSSIFRG
jgi:hypothetical protein